MRSSMPHQHPYCLLMRLEWTTLPRGVRYDSFMTRRRRRRNPDNERPFRTEANVKRLLFSCVMLGLSVAPITAQTVPELPFESVPNPLTLPDDVHFRRNRRRRRQFEGARLRVLARQLDRAVLHGDGRAVARVRRRRASSSARSARTSTRWSYAHAVRIDKDDNIWVVDKGSDMILKMNPQGRVVWVFGRKGEVVALHVPPDYAVARCRAC